MSGYEVLEATTLPFSAGRNVNLDPILLACSAGKVPVGGGHKMMSPSSHQLSLLMSGPVNTDTFKGWRVEVKNSLAPTALSGAEVKIFVVCAQMQ